MKEGSGAVAQCHVAAVGWDINRALMTALPCSAAMPAAQELASSGQTLGCLWGGAGDFGAEQG